MTPRRVLLTGMFDMQNYGDLLFPLVARHRLAAAGYETVAVAPTGQPTGLPDAMPAIGLSALMTDDDPIAGIVVGGGYIIHAHSMDFLEDYQTGGTGAWCGAGLWLGATVAAALRDVPILWNAPGVPHPFSTRQRPLVHAALRAATYAAVRDRGSATLLAAPRGAMPAVVPDTIADIARVWPKPTLTESFRRLLVRKGLPTDTRLLAIHVRNRSMAGLDAASLGAQLGRFAQAHGVVPMLVAVGRSHDDPGVARMLAPHVGRPLLLLDDPLELKEITAALAHAVAYVGASLHGYIVSAAYDVPGVLLGRPAYRKFAGFLEHTGRMQDLARDWKEALTIGAIRLVEPPSSRIPATVRQAIDEHWSAIVRGLRGPDDMRDARTRFLHALLRLGLASDGAGWPLMPFLGRMTRASEHLVHRRAPMMEGTASDG
ncbi:MAG: polysaccharide pyruvyl transferase family protein [Acetobacteraceae bacterium]